jgi:hydroxylamine reductase
MFCYQCEQTAKGTGCDVFGVCGKDPKTAALQDLLLHVAKGISMYAHRAAVLGAQDPIIDKYIIEALFTTVTNVNFDPLRLEGIIRQGTQVKGSAKVLYEAAALKANKVPDNLTGPAAWTPAIDLDGLVKQGEELVISKEISTRGADLTGLEYLIIFGLKGMAAYADHARVLGKEDAKVNAFFHEALDFLTQPDLGVDALLGMALRCGEVNIRIMELLDDANTSTYGHPVPTPVRISAVKGKAILVSGHDLKDLEELLKQTEGAGINIYTHGEMLPCHGYPGLKKFKHFVGNYGGAWQDQQKEFDAFPGSILMTTNCIQKPAPTYKDRIFTCGLVAWPGVTHIADRNFKPVIDAALAAPGFPADEPEKTILVGFGRNAVLGAAPKVIELVQAGKIKHFFLIGGCDGAKSGRNYYTDLATQVPNDCVILTLACGKYRFNKLEFGDIEGIPRLLDVGQCNDAYSAVRIAMALADAFKTDVNGLPLSLVLSWYEQKAVCILLSLLFLGIRNIRIGPSAPAFLTPAVFQVLHDKLNLMPITTPEADLKAMLGK